MSETRTNVFLRARPTELKQAGYVVCEWHHTVPAELPVDELLDTSFFAHVHRLLQPHHRIIVDAEDLSWTAKLIVTSSHKGGVSTVLVEHTELDARPLAAVGSPDLYYAKWGGPTKRWRVLRKEDGEEVKDQFQSRTDAEKWITSHNQKAA